MFAARVLVALAATAAVGIAMAQSPAPLPPAAAEPPACVKPDAHPGRLASDMRKKQWVKDVNAWRDCMGIYISELQARANSARAVANRAVEDFNSTVKELQEQLNAASGQ
jgi:hypothetical protein